MRLVREATAEQVAAGAFDPMTQSQTYDMEWEDADGRHSLRVRERGYVPTELALLLRFAGFAVEHVWGGTAGDWGRRPVELDEYEVMVVARRPRRRGAPESTPGAGRRGERAIRAFATGRWTMRPGVARLINGVIAEGAPVLLTGSFSDEEERAFLAALAAARRLPRRRRRGARRPRRRPRRRRSSPRRSSPPTPPAMPAHDHVAVMGTWVAAAVAPPRTRPCALGAHVRRWRRERGFTKVFTDVRADNLDSLAFHLALGFSVVGAARRQAVIGGRAYDVVFIERGL